MSYIKVSGSGLIKLSSNYGYDTISISNIGANSTIDATGASWNLSNSRNQFPDADTSYDVGSGLLNKYPVIVYDAGFGLTLRGGTIWGEVPQESDWQYTYNNSAAVRVANAPGVIVEDWSIHKAWDGIRFYVGSDNWLIDDVLMTNLRDDAVENDYVLTGTIRDSLFDGVFSGISLGNGEDADGSDNVVTLQNVFMRNQSYLYEGEMTHGTPFKMDTGEAELAPDLRIFNSIIAIEDVNHLGYARLKLAWESVVESSGNVFLNLSDTPLPSNYPMPPAGFTVLQGQQARDYWEAAEALWRDNHDGSSFADVTPLPPLPGATTVTPPPPPPPTTEPTPSEPTPITPTPTPTPAPTAGSTINGTKNADTLIGTAGNDVISGSYGADILNGKGGSDTLTGGNGGDKFIFDARLGDGVDTITDFNTSGDLIYLDNAIFTQLGSGSMSSPTRLNKSWFEKGVADDANDYILYDSNTGVLSYDADGNGAGAPVAFAQLSTGLSLSHFDFFVV